MKDLNEFNFYESYNTEGNQIIIAIRRNIKVTRVISKIPRISTYNAPIFLHIEIMINGVKYQVLGIRIRIDDYKERRKQFEYFSNYISDLNNVIILGDFNNSYIRGDLKASYSKTKKLYVKICKNKEKYRSMNTDKTGIIDVEKGYPDYAVLWAEVKL